jgi:glycosyltransferase involved in cell wall biosynthesis
MRVRFDLIVAHHCEGVFVGALLRALLGLPLVGHLHARLAYELPTYGIRPRWPRLWQLAGAAVDHLCAQLPDGIVTLSQADACFARRVRRDQGSPAVVTVRPQVEQPSATPTGLRWQTRSLHTPETFWAVYSGNADGYQNLPLLVDAMGYLTRRCPAARLLVATHGSLDRLHNLNWPHNVVLRSATDYTQMQQLLRQATVGVCPRRLPTGYPIKCLNYWACGLTVVGLRRMARAVWGNSKQDCVHGRAIWTVDHPHSFAEGILAAFRI